MDMWQVLQTFGQKLDKQNITMALEHKGIAKIWKFPQICKPSFTAHVNLHVLSAPYMGEKRHTSRMCSNHLCNKWKLEPTYCIGPQH